MIASEATRRRSVVAFLGGASFFGIINQTKSYNFLSTLGIRRTKTSLSEV